MNKKAKSMKLNVHFAGDRIVNQIMTPGYDINNMEHHLIILGALQELTADDIIVKNVRGKFGETGKRAFLIKPIKKEDEERFLKRGVLENMKHIVSTRFKNALDIRRT